MREIVIDLNQLELAPEDRLIAEACLNKGRLRASKPNPKSLSEADAGIAKYVWRMLVFTVSDESRHQCMPVCADFDLPGPYGSDEFKAAKDRGDKIEKAVLAIIPKKEWAGIARWGRAMGY